MNIKTLFVSTDATLQEAIKIIDHGAAQIALVVDEDEILLGTLTDGDIRRGLIKGYDLQSPVGKLMNREFCSLSEDVTENRAVQLMNEKDLHHIPVISSQGQVIKIYLMKELLKQDKFPNSVVIMAGGEGNRLRPLTEDCPKPMLNIGNKPMLEIILEQFIKAGFKKYYISVNYLKEKIINHFDDGSKWGVEIQYLEEKKPLGTAGGLRLIPEEPTNPLLIINGDVLTRTNFKKMLLHHEQQQAKATVCVRSHETEIPYGVISTEGLKVIQFEEKPVLRHHINAGLYVIEPSLIKLLSKDQHCHMPELLTKVLTNNEKVVVFPVHEYWLDVGHPETLAKASGEW
jgi:dTDP-glucose pyrophosphorylase